MARVLFGWEFGAGLGHVMRLLPIATALREAGHEPIFAVQDLRTVHDLFSERPTDSKGFALLQAPYWHPPRHPNARKVPTHSFADVLKLYRYGDTALLSAMVEGWSGILHMIAPDLVVLDFAPTAALATAALCPTVVLGNGYTVPPAGRRLPPIRPWKTGLPSSSLAAEDEILRAVNAIQKARHRPPISFLSDLFSGDETFVCTIPEFDPYAAYRHHLPLPPFNLPKVHKHPPIETRAENTVFLYLPADHPNLRAVLTALAELNVTCDAFIPGLPASLKSLFASTKLRFYEKPQPLAEILPRVRTIVHHGGLATAYAALLAGTPQLVLTRSLEHLITAHGLKRFKTALVLSGNRNHSPQAVAQSLRAALSNQEIWRAAQMAAEALAPTLDLNPLDTIVQKCEGLLQCPS